MISSDFFLILHLNIGFSSVWKGNYVGKHVLQIILNLLYIEKLLAIAVDSIQSCNLNFLSSLEKKGTLPVAILMAFKKDENLLTSGELLRDVPFLTGLGVALGSFLDIWYVAVDVVGLLCSVNSLHKSHALQ